MSELFRCSLASRGDGEPLAGTAPTETVYLLVEYAGAWGAKAVAESRLPEAVKERLLSLTGVNVMLIRRHGGRSGPGVRLFTAHLTPTEATIETAVVGQVEDLLDLDLDKFASSGRLGGPMRPYEQDLHLVCTNGRRDLCCAELGRPVAAAVTAAWPDETWECTHLGGHRFAATLLSLPSALCLGRLDAESAVLALEEVEVGRHPVGFSRGRAGLSAAEQAAQLYVVEQTSLDDLGDVLVLDSHPDSASGQDDVLVRLLAAGERWSARVRRSRVDRRQSCGDSPPKPSLTHEVVSAGPLR